MGHYDLGWRLWRQNSQMIDDIALQVWRNRHWISDSAIVIKKPTELIESRSNRYAVA